MQTNRLHVDYDVENDADKAESSKEMRPYVHRFIMNHKNGAGSVLVAVKTDAVARLHVCVVVHEFIDVRVALLSDIRLQDLRLLRRSVIFVELLVRVLRRRTLLSLTRRHVLL